MTFLAYHGEIGREATAKRSFRAHKGLGKSAALRAPVAKWIHRFAAAPCAVRRAPIPPARGVLMEQTPLAYFPAPFIGSFTFG